jgi:hypothetical protein
MLSIKDSAFSPFEKGDEGGFDDLRITTNLLSDAPRTPACLRVEPNSSKVIFLQPLFS